MNSSDSTDLDRSCGLPFLITTLKPVSRRAAVSVIPVSRSQFCASNSSQTERPRLMSVFSLTCGQKANYHDSAAPLYPVCWCPNSLGFLWPPWPSVRPAGGRLLEPSPPGRRQTYSADSPILTANHRTSLSLSGSFFSSPLPDPCNKTGFSSA